ncbi:tetratricopeptide repeat protein [Chryseobacterium sp. ERMR1:04]|uniref:tetratricopeptide repeat protein n=1 Tax=Chryseobacterium sp. ERMR1:04 TaxID=1705393 RepID=UPI000F4EE5B6|nr:hypothetical protein [Chryseobacterium sp. ERMR1:04]
MKTFLILIILTFISCKQGFKENIQKKEILPVCRVLIKDHDLLLICGDKKIIYKDLIINEMSVSTNLINDAKGNFSLLYELNASTTKTKEKYDFIYSENWLALVYKEIIKFGKDGITLNRLYLDNFDILNKSYEDLQSLGSNLSEEFRKNNITSFIYNSKNILFAKIIHKSSPEDVFINYPNLEKAPLIIDNVEVANNQAYSLEQKGAVINSKYLLTAIISQYPNRIVAYINLADVDWKLGDKENAKKNYSLYLSQMKSQKKDLSKIPQRVYDRIK